MCGADSGGAIIRQTEALSGASLSIDRTNNSVVCILFVFVCIYVLVIVYACEGRVVLVLEVLLLCRLRHSSGASLSIDRTNNSMGCSFGVYIYVLDVCASNSVCMQRTCGVGPNGATIRQIEAQLSRELAHSSTHTHQHTHTQTHTHRYKSVARPSNATQQSQSSKSFSPLQNARAFSVWDPA
jgi:hypothetical protein